jgi:hypothetical protein
MGVKTHCTRLLIISPDVIGLDKLPLYGTAGKVNSNTLSGKGCGKSFAPIALSTKHFNIFTKLWVPMFG